MEPDRLARIALWVFAAGNLAWVIANAIGGNAVNVGTDLVIVVGALIAAWGLPDAVDGLGPGRLKTGLLLVAVPEFLQNVVTATTKLGGSNAAPVLVVLVTSAALGVGAVRWTDDGWDRRATPWIALGFLGLGFEPLYYFILQAAGGNPFGRFFAGALGVAAGSLMSAWAFRPGSEVEQVEAVAPAPVPRPRGRSSK